MKKTVSLILCLAMIFTLSPVTVAAERDISQTAPGINGIIVFKEIGSTGSAAMITNGLKQFSFCPVFIRAEFAKIIDDYFSMFGYATHRTKVPNITGRPSWNYVKTIDAKIIGSVPFGDMERIKQMFNDGVTFWHGDWVGDYTRNNK